MSKRLMFAACALAAVGAAQAGNGGGRDDSLRPAQRDLDWRRDSGSPASSAAFAAPEIDPASAAAGLTLLLGGIAVLRGRRGK